MDFEKEINLLKFQLKLMSHAIDWKNRLWLRFVIDNGINEHQAETLTQVLTVLRYRLDGGNPHELYEESEWEPNEYELSIKSLFRKQPPTYQEFASYCVSILGRDIEPLLVLSYRKENPLHAKLCTYLLEEAENQP